MTENEISRVVFDTCLRIHQELGPGLLESVYETVLEYELRLAGLNVQRQVPIPVKWQGLAMDDGFRADLVVNGRVIIELKSLEVVPKVAYKILLTYLRLTGCHLGLLVNFGEYQLKDGVKRVVNQLPE